MPWVSFRGTANPRHCPSGYRVRSYSYPLQRSFEPGIDQAEAEHGDEDKHLDPCKDGDAAIFEDHRPGKEKKRFNVKYDEKYGDNEEMNSELTFARLSDRHQPAFPGFEFARVRI